MYLLYSVGLSVLFVALLPYFAYQAIRHGKYAGSFKQRLGRLPQDLRGDGTPTIWVHAVSVGEYLAARPLIERLKREMPDHRLVVSTTTLTGQRLAKSHALEGVFYFPFDWVFAARRALEHVRPSIVIILETELWPNFLRECRRRGVLTVLVNGRLSPRSFRRYRRVGGFIRKAVQDFSLVVMQSPEDADRVRELGASPSRVRVCGNLKYDSLGNDSRGFGDGDDLDRQLALSASPHLIVAGSTAPGEEEMLLDALREVRRHSELDDARLLIAPRHPERFDEVASLLARSEFTFARRSELAAYPAVAAARQDETLLQASPQSEVILLDTIGELASVYRFASVVFVGGSLVPRGGHNILEPAACGKPILVGPHTENFRQIMSDFERKDAVVPVTAETLGAELSRLLGDPDRARAIGERAREILVKHRGATVCTVSAIKEVMLNHK